MVQAAQRQAVVGREAGPLGHATALLVLRTLAAPVVPDGQTVATQTRQPRPTLSH